MKEHSFNRRDLLRIAGLAGTAITLGGLIGYGENIREQSLRIENESWRLESSKYREVFFEPDKTISLENGNEKRVFVVPGTGVIYTKEYDAYHRLDTIGLMTFPDDPYSNLESLDLLNSRENDLVFEGAELMFVWDEAKGFPVQSEALENAKSKGIRVMPDIKYALLSKIDMMNIYGIQSQEWFVDPKKVELLMREYPETVIGFTFDEPYPDASFDGARYDFERIASQYVDLCDLPINVCARGMLSAVDDVKNSAQVIENQKYVTKIRKLLTDRDILVIGGSFCYPTIYGDAKAPPIIERLVDHARREFDADNVTPSFMVLPAHDTGQFDTPNDFDNIVAFGDQLPYLGEVRPKGDVLADLTQIVVQVAANLTYCGVRYWDWPLDNDPNTPPPYSKMMKGIVESTKLLGAGRHGLNGKTLFHANDLHVAYTRKQIINGVVGTNYEAVFVHVKSNGWMPKIGGLKENCVYKDTISGLVFKTDIAGQIISNHNIPKNTVFCLVPAHED
ncbi:MAG: hypothetical protein WCL07_04610 [bacterium]